MDHSKTFPLSGADRWTNCNGSPMMCFDEPNIDTPESIEGVAAHWVCQQMLDTYKLGGDGLLIGQAVIGRKAPNGVIITDDMFDGALTYYNVIIAVVGNDRDNLLIEQRVTANHTLDPEAWGTADAVYYDPKTNTLYIWDFKYGHYSVVAFENYQLIAYALATCETFNYTKLNPRLSLNIVQPRCYDGVGPVRNWLVAFDDLRGYTNIMKHSIIQHRMNKGKVTSGKWCRNCVARYKCPAIRQAAAVVIDYSTTAIPINMSNEALAYELDIIELGETRVKDRKTALVALASARIHAGQLIPGRRMQDSVGNRNWINPDQVYMLGETFGVDFHSEVEPITPAKAEAKLKAIGVDGSIIKPYVHKPKTGVKLVADDGSRARQIFSQEKI